MAKHFLSTVVALCFFTALNAQAPQKLNYQAVVRNTAGQPVTNTAVKLKFTIRDASTTGTPVYSETINHTTNAFGLANVEIGTGGNLGIVNWGSGLKFLQVEADINTGTFVDMGTTQLISVPYALYAANSAAGPPGQKGATGPTGATGAPGAGGGTTGPTGPQGDAGLPGATGPTGLQGDAGLPGSTGPQGDVGLKGDTGPTGPKGDTGPAGTGGNVVTVPIGTIVAWHKSAAGTPTLPTGWVECNGQTISNSNSPYDGQAVPNLNGTFTTEAGTTSAGGRFLRGHSTSGTMAADKTNTVSDFGYDGSNGNCSTCQQPVPVSGAYSQTLRYEGDPPSQNRGFKMRNRGVETNPGYMTVVWIIRVE